MAARRLRPKLSRTRIARMIEEATVDCYNDDEQHEGLLVTLEEHLRCPVPALVVGEAVTVLRFDREPSSEIVAICHRGRRAFRINVTALEWPSAPPLGAEWVEAYRAWLRGGGAAPLEGE
jgi:hypothetical protein